VGLPLGLAIFFLMPIKIDLCEVLTSTPPLLQEMPSLRRGMVGGGRR
jgi:hypothetical protein